MSFVSSKGNILCRLIKIELYKIFAIINRAIKGLHCTSGIDIPLTLRFSMLLFWPSGVVRSYCVQTRV